MAVTVVLPEGCPMITTASEFAPSNSALTLVWPAFFGRIVTVLPATEISAMFSSAQVHVTMSFVTSPLVSNTHAVSFLPSFCV